VDHYRDVSGELLENHSFEAGLSGWHSSQNLDMSQSGTVNLSNWKPSEGHFIHQTLSKPASGIVRISADAQIGNVKIGPEVWHSARIDVLGREAEGDWRWDFANTLFQETGTLAMRDISKIIHIPVEFSEIRVESELTGGTGTYLVGRISLTEVESRFSVRLLTYLLLACWLLLGVAIIVALVRLQMWLEGLILSLASILLLLISETFKQEILGRLEVWIPGINNFAVDHLLLFFAATIIICYNINYKQISDIRNVVFSLVTFSLATEALQYYTSHREPRLLDSLTNIAGISLAALIFLAHRVSKLLAQR
jgi:uncharacterized membrane protein required for colicin V production